MNYQVRGRFQATVWWEAGDGLYRWALAWLDAPLDGVLAYGDGVRSRSKALDAAWAAFDKLAASVAAAQTSLMGAVR